jgi:hypothetical protein
MDLSLDFGKVRPGDNSMNMKLKAKGQRLTPINFGNYVRRSPMSQLDKRRKPLENVRYSHQMKNLILKLPDA